MWSNNSAAPFLLTGFLGSEGIHHWISIPFLAIYLSILSGNGTLLLLIWNDHSLHEPMYYFLAVLAGTDLSMTLTTMPTVLRVLLLDRREIAQGACFIQSYFIHSLAIVESGVLLAMAYDRFVRFGKHAPHVVHVTMSYVYFLFPPFMNPIIYSIKTKQIQRSIIHLFSVHSRA
ncbi:olfactory receptor 51B6-like [Fukomys damarensis]|uniref:olfactory receptor 51B6-like n=1 Tax=Fukomys damarensis TaxID=885580 RepID=UPI0008FEB2BF|nr:olfactory receptor 51B6-like [Fukomys damarensis]